MKRHLIPCLLVILILCNALTVQSQKKKLSFDDFFKDYTFYQSSIRGLNSMNDGIHYSSVEDRNSKIVERNFSDGEINKVLFDCVEDKAPFKFLVTYQFNFDESKILITTDYEPIYRRSYKANFYVYDIKSKKLEILSENGKQQLATFSPDGKKVAFVRENNLFYKNIELNEEIQVTFDGKYNEIINGAPDWVYEEEFEFSRAFDWSPDSKTIAWIRFDERLVPEFSMYMFQGQEPELNQYKLYPGIQTFKYPKAGDPNSIVTVNTFNIDTKKTQKVDIGTETDQYIPRIKFTKSADKLAVYRLNRLQNFFEILLANPADGSAKTLYEEKNQKYIDEKYFDKIQFLDDKEHFIILSEKSGFSHLYLYTMNGVLKKQISEGDFDVTDFYGYNPKDKMVFYQTATPMPYQREVFQINIDNKKSKKINTELGNNSASFSKSFEYCILKHSSINVPPTTVLLDKKHKSVRVLVDNKEIIEKVNNYQIPTKEFISFKTSEGVLLYGWMIKPFNFDKDKKYPVFMTQYSGPNSQSAMDEWSLSWEEYLASNDYIVVCVDGRGTGGRGEDFRKVTYMELGKYETIDQIETAKYLQTLTYVNPDRIGIWGWSFGGYISSSCLAKGDGIFKMGIAVAPVTNWRYYDNIYTERFMRTPQENPDGYDQNSPLNFAKDFKGKFLLCHGTADDNVHVQNAMELAERLVQANFQFDMQLYTNRNHGIYGGNTTYHLYTKMTNFIFENL